MYFLGWMERLDEGLDRNLLRQLPMPLFVHLRNLLSVHPWILRCLPTLIRRRLNHLTTMYEYPKGLTEIR